MCLILFDFHGIPNIPLILPISSLVLKNRQFTKRPLCKTLGFSTSRVTAALLTLITIEVRYASDQS